jgi:N-acetylglutamate synthase-like GNAT family acetyltransferase
MTTLQLRERDEDLARAFPVLSQLRPHLTVETFVAQARRQREAHGWCFATVEEGDRVLACAGYRIAEWLAWGKALYVDDLVTDETTRSQGHGDRLFDWLVLRAREAGCAELHLDSGVQRFAAHRFYLRKRMNISSHHFALKLAP